VNTKVDPGPCDKVHLEELKEQFEQSGDLYIFDAEIERDFLNRINDIDRTIKVLKNSTKLLLKLIIIHYKIAFKS
jgi:hypothetical protein